MAINYDSKTEVSLEEKRMDLGVVGRFIGSGDQARFAITLIVIIFLLLIACAVTFLETPVNAEEFWDLVVPIVTLGLGYIFGQRM